MSNKTDWKSKYYELRSKYMNAIDVSFRLGFEEGKKESDMQAAQMQLQQMQEAAAMGGMQGGEPGMEGGGELPPEAMEGAPEGGGELPPEAMEGAPEGGDNELDASIDELEQYVKSEQGKRDYAQLLKSFHKNKTTTTESKDSRVKKLNSIIQKWEEDSESEGNDLEAMGEI